MKLYGGKKYTVYILKNLISLIEMINNKEEEEPSFE